MFFAKLLWKRTASLEEYARVLGKPNMSDMERVGKDISSFYNRLGASHSKGELWLQVEQRNHRLADLLENMVLQFHAAPSDNSCMFEAHILRRLQ